jgi:WD40 repeat protein
MSAHSRGINSVAFSPDGKRIMSGSDDRTIKVWDSGAFWAKIPKFEPLLIVSASRRSYTRAEDRESQRSQQLGQFSSVLARWEQNCVWQSRQDDQSLGFRCSLFFESLQLIPTSIQAPSPQNLTFTQPQRFDAHTHFLRVASTPRGAGGGCKINRRVWRAR